MQHAIGSLCTGIAFSDGKTEIKSINKIILFILIFMLVGVGVSIWFPREAVKNDSATLRIGAGDDISGLLMDEIIDAMDETYEIDNDIGSAYFQDCCSNTAQWAMNAKEINIAFCCKHIAQYTMEHNSNVIIYAPVIMNSEVISYKEDWSQVETIGIAQGREYLKSHICSTYPQIGTFAEITSKGILYALEDQQIDAAVLDITKAAQVPDYQYQPIAEDDYISYVIIVDQELIDTEVFADFITAFNNAIARLEKPDYLAGKLGVDTQWLEDKRLKFLEIE